MSLKSPKKSDLQKSWMKKRRDKVIRIQPEYHLIVTEGTDTEPQYFGAIRDVINSRYRGRVQLDIYGEGDNTLSLFEKAKNHASENPNGYKHVWVVYDTDDFPADRINRTAELCIRSSTEETQYHAVWSNQCIELWFLLHFGFFQSDIHRKEYWPKLTQWLTSLGAGVYTKGREDMYEVLKPFMENAIRNAKRLDALNNGRPPASAAPGTKVYELIEKLKPYLETAE
ncbi:MAG: RloB family protein [Faecousia sp.]